MSKLNEFFAEVNAMAREAVKDVRQTANEVYFGKGEHAAEMGAPLNPLPRETYEQKHQIEPEKGRDIEME